MQTVFLFVILNLLASASISRAATTTLPVPGDLPLYQVIPAASPDQAPLEAGSVDFKVYVDRTSIEVFADKGLVYIPQPLTPPVGEPTLSLHVEGGQAVIDTLDVYQLKSAWK